MKILHVHYTDWITRSGGGVIAMHRLHEGLKRAHVDSRILAKVTHSLSSDTIPFPKKAALSVLEKVLGRATVRLGFNDIHCLNAFALNDVEAYRAADVVDFHGLQGGYFSYLALPTITRDKAAVLTLHDIWPFTGHCAYSYDCERWKTGCGKCPYLNTSPPVRMDNTRLEWKLKEWVYSRSNLTIIAPSKRTADQAKQSMLKQFPIFHIPHGIDTTIFRPLDQRICRTLLGVSSGKTVVMFAAAKLSQANKGPDLLIQALNSLPAPLKANVVLLILGDQSSELQRRVEVPVIDLGYVSGDLLKAIAYSSADVLVSPTRAETFGLVILESMACGTPVVAFDVGGVSDLVRSGENGILVEAGNVTSLTEAIVRVAEDERLRERLSEECRRIVVREYSLDLQVERYIKLYGHVLRN